MNFKTACLGALAFTMLGGVALAGALDEPKMMAPFFTDAGMKTMQPDADMKKAWAGMAKADHDKMSKECNDAAMSKPHAKFCEKMKALGGSK
jgi:hypothetical protein